MKVFLSIILSYILVCLVSKGDVIVSNATRTIIEPVTTETTNIITHTEAKIVWTSFSIRYSPPSYTNAIYSLIYHLYDTIENKEIPNTRTIKHLKESELAEFMISKGMDISGLQSGVGDLINEYLKEQFKSSE